MHRYLLLIWGGIVIIMAAPQGQDVNSKIIEETNNNDGSGNYNFSYKTSNGLYRMEVGEVINPGPDQKFAVRGSFSYIDPDGKEVVVYYTADENGYVTMKPAIIEFPIHGVPGPVLASLLGSG